LNTSPKPSFDYAQDEPSTTLREAPPWGRAGRLGQIGTGAFSRDLEVWWAKLRGKQAFMDTV